MMPLQGNTNACGKGFWQRQDYIRVLRKLRPWKSAKELSKLFGKSVNAIYNALYRNEIVVQPKRKT